MDIFCMWIGRVICVMGVAMLCYLVFRLVSEVLIDSYKYVVWKWLGIIEAQEDFRYLRDHRKQIRKYIDAHETRRENVKGDD